MRAPIIALAAFVLIATAPGCASIISGRAAQVKINSNPPDAHVSVRDQEGSEVASATTPATVSLKRGRTWFRPARYTATLSKDGYQTAQVPIRSTFNPWLLGNVVAGGVVGLAVDGATGAGWKPKPGEIVQNLQPLGDSIDEPMGNSETELASAEEPVAKPSASKRKPRVAVGGRKSPESRFQ